MTMQSNIKKTVRPAGTIPLPPEMRDWLWAKDWDRCDNNKRRELINYWQYCCDEPIFAQMSFDEWRCHKNQSAAVAETTEPDQESEMPQWLKSPLAKARGALLAVGGRNPVLTRIAIPRIWICGWTKLSDGRIVEWQSKRYRNLKLNSFIQMDNSGKKEKSDVLTSATLNVAIAALNLTVRLGTPTARFAVVDVRRILGIMTHSSSASNRIYNELKKLETHKFLTRYETGTKPTKPTKPDEETTERCWAPDLRPGEIRITWDHNMLFAAIRGGHWQHVSALMFALLREHPLAQRLWMLYCGSGWQYTGKRIDILRDIFGSNDTVAGFRYSLRQAVARVADITGQLNLLQSQKLPDTAREELSKAMFELKNAAAGYGIGITIDAQGEWRWSLEPSRLQSYLQIIDALAQS